MVKTRELSESERLMIYRLRINGQKYKEIAEKINCTESGAQKAFKKIERLGSARNWLRSGRNRCTTERTDSLIAWIVSKTRKTTAKEVKEELKTMDINVSESTIKRRLRETVFWRNSTK